MPKLNAAAAKAVEQTEAVHGGGFELLKPGKYLGQLTEVSVRENPDKYGAAQWSAEFQNLHSIETREPVSGRQWLNLTMPLGKKAPANYENGAEKWEKYQAMVKGRLAAFFEAFGYTPDSDTDEMLLEWAVITVGVQTIQQGPKQGEKRNVVNDIESLDKYGDLDSFGITQAGEDEEF